MGESRPGGLAGIVTTVVAVQVALGLLIAGAYISSHNSLYNNGNWSSTKTELAGGIIGAQSFVFNLQGLAKGRLHPSTWFGNQEVVSRRSFDPASIEFEFWIGREAHLTFEFGRTESRYAALRISASDRYPDAFLIAAPSGEFLVKRPFRQLRRARNGREHILRLDFNDEGENGFTVFLNDKELRSFRTAIDRPMRIGFRGGTKPVYVDNVKVVERNSSVFRETFERPRNWRTAYAISVLAVLLFSAVLFLLLRRTLAVSDKLLLFSFLMASGVLLIVAALLVFLVWRQAEFYPNATERLQRRQAAYADAGAERMIERIESAYSEVPAPGVERLLFIGSSQMRGSGAASEDQTIVRNVERLLNAGGIEETGSQQTHFECLNVAVRAYEMSHMLRDFERHWVNWQPSLVVVNAGYNDRDTTSVPWKQSLWALVAAARAKEIPLVFIPEASSAPIPSPNLERIHTGMRQVARNAGVPRIEMSDLLNERYDDGFLWWDSVHLTSFGQQIFAEHLVAELIRLNLVQPNRPTSQPGHSEVP